MPASIILYVTYFAGVFLLTVTAAVLYVMRKDGRTTAQQNIRILMVLGSVFMLAIVVCGLYLVPSAWWVIPAAIVSLVLAYWRAKSLINR